MNPVINDVFKANRRCYKVDRGHPCANFCFDVLREIDPSKYTAIAEQIRGLEWGQSNSQRSLGHRSKMFGKYIRLFGFRAVTIPQNYDLCFMAEASGTSIYHCGLYHDAKIIHLHPKNRDLCVDNTGCVNIISYGRK